eukprot:Sdes_comp20582_c0_seq1m15529
MEPLQEKNHFVPLQLIPEKGRVPSSKSSSPLLQEDILQNSSSPLVLLRYSKAELLILSKSPLSHNKTIKIPFVIRKNNPDASTNKTNPRQKKFPKDGMPKPSYSTENDLKNQAPSLIPDPSSNSSASASGMNHEMHHSLMDISSTGPSLIPSTATSSATAASRSFPDSEDVILGPQKANAEFACSRQMSLAQRQERQRQFKDKLPQDPFHRTLTPSTRNPLVGARGDRSNHFLSERRGPMDVRNTPPANHTTQNQANLSHANGRSDSFENAHRRDSSSDQTLNFSTFGKDSRPNGVKGNLYHPKNSSYSPHEAAHKSRNYNHRMDPHQNQNQTNRNNSQSHRNYSMSNHSHSQDRFEEPEWMNYDGEEPHDEKSNPNGINYSAEALKFAQIRKDCISASKETSSSSFSPHADPEKNESNPTFSSSTTSSEISSGKHPSTHQPHQPSSIDSFFADQENHESAPKSHPSRFDINSMFSIKVDQDQSLLDTIIPDFDSFPADSIPLDLHSFDENHQDSTSFRDPASDPNTTHSKFRKFFSHSNPSATQDPSLQHIQSLKSPDSHESSSNLEMNAFQKLVTLVKSAKISPAENSSPSSTPSTFHKPSQELDPNPPPPPQPQPDTPKTCTNSATGKLSASASSPFGGNIPTSVILNFHRSGGKKTSKQRQTLRSPSNFSEPPSKTSPPNHQPQSDPTKKSDPETTTTTTTLPANPPHPSSSSSSDQESSFHTHSTETSIHNQFPPSSSSPFLEQKNSCVDFSSTASSRPNNIHSTESHPHSHPIFMQPQPPAQPPFLPIHPYHHPHPHFSPHPLPNPLHSMSLPIAGPRILASNDDNFQPPPPPQPFGHPPPYQVGPPVGSMVYHHPHMSPLPLPPASSHHLHPQPPPPPSSSSSSSASSSASSSLPQMHPLHLQHLLSTLPPSTPLTAPANSAPQGGNIYLQQHPSSQQPGFHPSSSDLFLNSPHLQSFHLPSSNNLSSTSTPPPSYFHPQNINSIQQHSPTQNHPQFAADPLSKLFGASLKSNSSNRILTANSASTHFPKNAVLLEDLERDLSRN